MVETNCAIFYFSYSNKKTKLSTMADLQKKLKVKTGTCKRLNKDLEYYKKEEKQIQEKIEKLKQENADAYTIKKQEEVLGESLTMITDSRNRLETALTDIRDHMVSASINLIKKETADPCTGGDQDYRRRERSNSIIHRLERCIGRN
jgi:tubulin-specific chaperone A